MDDEGIATRGMIVRHLVLPHGLSQTPAVLHWLAENLGRDLYFSLMAQYFPAYPAVGDAEVGRRITPEEYKGALAALEAEGLGNGWAQELEK